MLPPSYRTAAGLNEIYDDPYRNLVAMMIYWAKEEAELDIEKQTWPHHIRIMGAQKREALAFIFSKDLEFWIRVARLPFDAGALRDKLRPELAKMPRVEELIQLNYPKNVGKRKKDENKKELTELEPSGLVK